MKTETWTQECEEWQRIGNEMMDASGGQPVTAFEVSQEQERRMSLRGVRPLTYDEILQEAIWNSDAKVIT